MTINRNTFTRRLKDSEYSVWKIANWLWLRNHDITIPTRSICPPGGNPMDHVDNGDFFMDDKRCEVKHYFKLFTSEKDYPYPRFTITNKNAWDRAEVKPYMYYYLNKDGTHIAYTSGRSNENWDVVNQNDPKYGSDHYELAYSMPTKEMRFTPL